MANKKLFWATGVTNDGLKRDTQETEQIFASLAKKVNLQLDSITQKYGNLLRTNSKSRESKLITSLIKQLETLGATIDKEKMNMSTMSKTSGAAMKDVSKAASNFGKNVPKTSPLRKTVKAIHTDVKVAERDISFLERRFRYAIGSMIAYGSINILGNLAKNIIQVKGTFDQLKVSIDSFVGSAREGKEIMEQLTTLAVKSPFQLIDITDSAKQLLAYGEDAKSVTETVQKLSDVSSGSGQSIRDIAYLYGTSLTQGRLYARDLFQFANRGVPIYQALAATMKGFNGEVGISTEQVKNMTSAGAVGFEQLKAAVDYMTLAGGKYYGLSDKLAETTYGRISNLQDKWTMALKEMGEESESVVNSGVEGVTYLIEHWKSLATAIGVAAAAVGTYQIAKMAIGVQANLSSTASNMAEAKSLESLIAANKGLTKSNVEATYGVKAKTMALREEVEQILVNTNAELVATRSLNKVTKARMIDIKAQIALERKNIAAKEASAIASGKQLSAEELKISQDKISTLTTEYKTASVALNTNTLKAGTLAAKKNMLVTGADAAINAGNAASVDLISIAKTKLIAITHALHTTMLANPYTAVFVVIASLVTVMWALHDSTTAEEKAEDKLQKTMDKLNKTIQDRKRAVGDLLNTIVNENEVDAVRLEALYKLQELYPKLLKGEKLENITRAEAQKLQKKLNEEIEKGRLAAQKEEVRLAKKDLEAKKKNKYTYGTGGVKIINVDAVKDIEAAQKVYDELKKNYERSLKAQANAKKKADEEATIQNKAFWTRQKTNAEGAISAIRSEYLKIFKSGGDTSLIPKHDLDVLQKQTKNLAEAEKNLKIYSTKTTGSSAKDTTVNIASLKAGIEADNAKLTDAKVQAEIKSAQSEVDAMEDGYLKKQEQQKINYAKELADIIKHKAKLLKIEQDAATKQYKLSHKDWKKSDLPQVSLSAGSKSIIDTETETAIKNDATARAKILKDRLKEFQDFETQKLEITKKYNDDKKAFEEDLKVADDKDAEKIVKAMAQAEMQYKEDIAKIDFTKLQKDINWGDVFGNLDKMSTEELKATLEKIKNFKDKADGLLSKTDIKAVSEGSDKIESEIIERDPFEALSNSLKEYKKATEEVTEAQETLNKVRKGTKIITSISVNENGKMVTTILSEVAAKAKLAKANKKQKKEGEKVKEASETAAEAMNGLIKSAGNVGQAMDDTSGQVISTIATTAAGTIALMSSITAVSKMEVSAIKSIEKASIILEILSLALELTTSIMNILGGGKSAATKSYEDLKAVSQGYLDVLNDIIDAQKEMLDTLSGSSAIDASEKIKESLEEELDLYRKLALAAAKAGGSWGSHSYGYRTNKALKDYWDSISKSAGEKIGSIYDFFDLTPEQLKNIKENNTYAWSLISDPIQENLDTLIDTNDAIADVIKTAKEGLTSMSLDDAKSAMDDFLTDADTTFADVADSFEENMKNAMLGLVKDRYLNDAMEGWYKSLTKNMSKGSAGNENLTADELQELEDSYKAIYEEAKRRMDVMANIAGMDTGIADNNDVTTAVKNISESTADLLAAQGVAVRVHVANIEKINSLIGGNTAEILVSLQNSTVDLDLIGEDISAIRTNTDRLKAIEESLKEMNDNGIKML